MDLHQVPQHQKNFRDGDKAPKKVLYVTDENGKYRQTTSVGWEAENVALQQAWEDIDERLAAEKQRVRKGISSALAYHLIKNRMDIGIFAAYAGKWQWQVKRHLKPEVFKKLSNDLLARYAKIFDITIEELKSPL